MYARNEVHAGLGWFMKEAQAKSSLSFFPGSVASIRRSQVPSRRCAQLLKSALRETEQLAPFS